MISAHAELSLEAWDGEGAEHTATGGDFGHAFLPTFVSSFYYTWLQGVLPLNGVSLTARQCLIGGNYGLLNKTTFAPNPDWYIAYIHRTLFDSLEGAVLGLEVNATGHNPGLKAFVYAGSGEHSARVTVLINLNIGPAAETNVSIPSLAGRSGEVWLLQSGSPVEVNSTTITLNHQPLRWNGTVPSLPALAVSTSDAGHVSMPAASIAFLRTEA